MDADASFCRTNVTASRACRSISCSSALLLRSRHTRMAWPTWPSPISTTGMPRAPSAKLPSFVGADLDGDAYGVFQVLSAKMPAQTDNARKEQLARSLQQTIGSGDDSAYVDALKTKYKAEVLRSDLTAEKSSPPSEGKDGK